MKRNGKQAVDNIDELYAKKQAERIESCKEEVSSVLEKHKCQLLISLQLGNQLVPLNQIVTVPGVVVIGSK